MNESTKRFRKGKPILNQSRFWDVLNRFEMPLVLFLQKITFIRYTYDFFESKLAFLASARLLAYSPLILYGLGQTERAKHFVVLLALYASFSSIGKTSIKRRRPGSYEEVYAPDVALTSSFPSRHALGAAIISFYVPFRWVYLTVIIVDRLIIGNHFLSDCIFGILTGNFLYFISGYCTHPMLVLILLVIGLMLWKSGAKILGGALPIICVPQTNLSPLVIPLIFVRHLTQKYVGSRFFGKPPAEATINNAFGTAVAAYLMYYVSSFLFWLSTKGILSESFVSNPLDFILNYLA